MSQSAIAARGTHLFQNTARQYLFSCNSDVRRTSLASPCGANSQQSTNVLRRSSCWRWCGRWIRVRSCGKAQGPSPGSGCFCNNLNKNGRLPHRPFYSNRATEEGTHHQLEFICARCPMEFKAGPTQAFVFVAGVSVNAPHLLRTGTKAELRGAWEAHAAELRGQGATKLPGRPTSMGLLKCVAKRRHKPAHPKNGPS